MSGSLVPPPPAHVLLPSTTAITPGRSRRLAVRAVLIAVALAASGLAWLVLAARAQADAQEPNAFAVGTLGNTLKSSLELTALALALGTMIGVAVAATGAGIERARSTRPALTAAAHATGRLLRTPWVALSPALLPVLVVLAATVRDGVGSRPPLVSGPSVLSTAVGAFVLAGIPAVLVAGSVGVRAGSPSAYLGSLLVGMGRGLVGIASVLTLVEAAFGLPVLSVQGGVWRVGSAQVIDVLVVIALCGLASIVAGDGLRGPSMSPAPSAARERLTSVQRGWIVLVLSLCAAVPLGIFAAAQADSSRASGGLTPTQVILGTFDGSILSALQIALGATIVGVAWGAVGGLARTWHGDNVADLLLAPAWLMALVPLLPAVLLVSAVPAGRALTLPLPEALVLLLLCRAALVARELRLWANPKPRALLQAAAGIFLVCVGVAFVAGIGLDSLAVGQNADVLGLSLSAPAHDPALRLALAAAGIWAFACIASGRALLRPVHRDADWFRLEA